MPAQQTTELTAGETLVECAIRESKEETGLMLRNDSNAAGIPVVACGFPAHGLC